jgi:hypothetical protein
VKLLTAIEVAPIGADDVAVTVCMVGPEPIVTISPLVMATFVSARTLREVTPV